MIKKHTRRRRTSLAKQLWGLVSPAGRCPLVHYHTLRLSSTFYFIIEVRVLVNAIIRVFLKMKNPFLWAGLRNPIVSMYKEAKYQFSEFFWHLLTISTIGFLFWVFIRGNRPKISPKYAIFKICPKLARKWYSSETRVHSTIFWDSWRQKVVSVFGFANYP